MLESQIYHELKSSPIPTLWFSGFCRSLSSHHLAAYCIILQYYDIPTLQDQWPAISASINAKNIIRSQLLQFCRELRAQPQPLVWLDARKENVLWDSSKQTIIIIDFEHMEALADFPTPFGFECAEIMEELSCDPEIYGRGQCDDSATGGTLPTFGTFPPNSDSDFTPTDK